MKQIKKLLSSPWMMIFVGILCSIPFLIYLYVYLDIDINFTSFLLQSSFIYGFIFVYEALDDLIKSKKSE